MSGNSTSVTAKGTPKIEQKIANAISDGKQTGPPGRKLKDAFIMLYVHFITDFDSEQATTFRMPENMTMYFSTPPRAGQCVAPVVEGAVAAGIERQGQRYLLQDPHRRRARDAPDASWLVHMGATLPGEYAVNYDVAFDDSPNAGFFGIKHMDGGGGGWWGFRERHPPSGYTSEYSFPLAGFLQRLSSEYPDRYKHVVVMACNPPVRHEGGKLAAAAVHLEVEAMRKNGLRNASKMSNAVKQSCGESGFWGKCWSRPRQRMGLPSNRNFNRTFDTQLDAEDRVRVLAEDEGVRQLRARLVPKSERAKKGVRMARKYGRSDFGCPCYGPCGEERRNMCRVDPESCGGREHDTCGESDGTVAPLEWGHGGIGVSDSEDEDDDGGASDRVYDALYAAFANDHTGRGSEWNRVMKRAMRTKAPSVQYGGARYVRTRGGVYRKKKEDA